MSKRSGTLVRKYKITFEYKAEGRPWRKLTDWAYGETAKDAVRQFRKGGPHIWPRTYRKIKATRI